MKQRYWHIEGYDSFTKIYDRKVRYGYFSENQIQNLLKTLSAKAGLSSDEIVGAYAKKNTNISNELLVIKKEKTHQVYMCGDNPHFIARVIVEEL
jgi:hypothetical protein